MTFTKEQLQQLKQYEPHFNTSLHQETLRSATRLDTERIRTIYEAATGSKVTQSMSCGSCKIRFYKTVAKLYFADLEEQKNTEYLSEGKSEGVSEGKSEGNPEEHAEGGPEGKSEEQQQEKKTKKSSKKNAKVNES